MNGNLLRFTLVMFIVYIAMQVFFIKKGNVQGKYLTDMLHAFDNEEEFFKVAEEGLQNEKNPEVLEKLKLLKAWGEAFYGHYDEYEETIHAVNLQTLVGTGKKSRVKDNEDAFFYLHLIIPNYLYGHGRMDLLKELDEITESIKEETKDMLTYRIHQANMDFYNKEGDYGQELYEEVLAGDYGAYTYSKQLIGIYKSMVSANLAAVYKYKGQTERYESMQEDLEFFANMPLGVRWIEELGLPVPQTELTEEISKENTSEEVQEETESKEEENKETEE